jgi:hypothetical protein
VEFSCEHCNEPLRFHKAVRLATSQEGRSSMKLGIARVFRRGSPPTRSRRSTGSGGESWQVWRGMQYRRSQCFYN